jgi:hypothetical protein
MDRAERQPWSGRCAQGAGILERISKIQERHQPQIHADKRSQAPPGGRIAFDVIRVYLRLQYVFETASREWRAKICR